MELTKADKRQLHDLVKRGVLRRCEDYYRNSMLLMGVNELLTNGYLTIDDFKDCRPEIQQKARQWLED